MQYIDAAGLDRPQNPRTGPVRRDARASAGIAILLGSLGEWRHRQLAIRQLELLDHVSVADELDNPLPIGAGAVIVVTWAGAERCGNGLHNLAVASSLELA